MNRREFLQTTTFAGTAVLLPFNNLFSFGRDDFEILLLNGNIIDGTGAKSFRADVGIINGEIAAIGKLSSASAGKIIDCTGLMISPGFIDIHTHTDLGILTNPKGESKIHQGITTEVGGQCGGSLAPISQSEFEKSCAFYNDKYGLNLKSNSFESHLQMMRDWNFSVNQANMAGLGTIREIVVGMDDRPATADELKKMQYEVEAAIKGGAVGISSGLEYTPGSFASTEELIALASAMPNGISKLYTTHMRNEDNTVQEAVAEAIEIARMSGARLELSHLKASGKSNWYKAPLLLELLDKAVEEGLEVHADRYTYVAYHTGVANLFPLWSRDGGSQAFMTRLKDKSVLPEIKEYAEKKVANLDGEWNGCVISGMRNKEDNKFKGLSIQEIADKTGTEPFEAAVNLLINSNGHVNMVGFGMSEEGTEKILSHPRVMIASDASAHAPYPPMNEKIPHPRAYGTFPRAIAKYVKERNICSLEEMIKKMTSMPADKLGIKDRGRIAIGKKADITIFNHNTIEDKATFLDSAQYPAGIPFVLVNGKIVIEEGNHTGSLPGEVITV